MLDIKKIVCVCETSIQWMMRSEERIVNVFHVNNKISHLDWLGIIFRFVQHPFVAAHISYFYCTGFRWESRSHIFFFFFFAPVGFMSFSHDCKWIFYEKEMRAFAARSALKRNIGWRMTLLLKRCLCRSIWIDCNAFGKRLDQDSFILIRLLVETSA